MLFVQITVVEGYVTIPYYYITMLSLGSLAGVIPLICFLRQLTSVFAYSSLSSQMIGFFFLKGMMWSIEDASASLNRNTAGTRIVAVTRSQPVPRIWHCRSSRFSSKGLRRNGVYPHRDAKRDKCIVHKHTLILWRLFTGCEPTRCSALISADKYPVFTIDYI